MARDCYNSTRAVIEGRWTEKDCAAAVESIVVATNRLRTDVLGGLSERGRGRTFWPRPETELRRSSTRISEYV